MSALKRHLFMTVGNPDMLNTQDVALTLSTGGANPIGHFNSVATFVVNVGSANVQTYLTADACRAMAAAMLAAADVLDKEAK